MFSRRSAYAVLRNLRLARRRAESDGLSDPNVNTVRYGSGPPAPALGIDGDFYIDVDVHDLYGPKSTVWPAPTSLIGPEGDVGPAGPQGPQGPAGADGVDGVDGAPGATGPMPTVSGTGFAHVTGGVWDAAATAVDLATSDVTGILPKAKQGAQDLAGDVTGNTGASVISGLAVSKLAPGTNGFWLTTSGGTAAWATPSFAASAITSGALAAARGGLGTSGAGFTGLVKAAAGVFSAATLVNADVSASAAIAVSKLAPSGTNGHVLTTVGGVPVWQAPSGGGVVPGTARQILVTDDAAAGTEWRDYIANGATADVPGTGIIRLDDVDVDVVTGTVGGSGYVGLAFAPSGSAWVFGNSACYSSVYGYSVGLISGAGPATVTDGLTGETMDLLCISKTLAANFTNNTASHVATNLSFTGSAGDVWEIEFFGMAQCSSTGGYRFRVTAPTAGASSIEGCIEGSTSAINTRSQLRVNAINADIAVTFGTVATTPSPVRMFARLKLDATGTVSIDARVSTAAQVVTLFAGAYLRARRVVEV